MTRQERDEAVHNRWRINDKCPTNQLTGRATITGTKHTKID